MSGPGKCKYLVACLYCDIYETFCDSKGTNKDCEFYDDEDGPLYGEG